MKWLLFSALLMSELAQAGAMALPPPRGGHPVGTTTLSWVDDSRTELARTSPDEPHQIVAQLWYPAQTGGKVAAYFPELNEAVEGFHSLKAAGDDRARLGDDLLALGSVKTSAYSEAPLARKPRQFPLVIFSPGGNVSRHSYSAFAQDLASRGWIVAVISHKYSGLDVFASGLALSSPKWVRPAALKEKKEIDAFWQPLADFQAADASFVLTQLEALNLSNPRGLFAGRIDPGHTAIIGHSRGVKTVARALARDARFKAGVMWDNLPPFNLPGELKNQPVMVMRTADWPADSVASLHQYLSDRDGPGIDAALSGVVHMSFTDTPFLSARGMEGATLTPEQSYQLIGNMTAAFLDTYVLKRSRKMAMPGSTQAVVKIFTNR